MTGAARGLGRAISLALADAGADVALGLRVGGDAADLAERIEAMGRRAHRVPMDLLDLDQVRTAVDEVVDVFDGIDILVNNAGIGPPETPAEDWEEADFDATFDLNVKGLFFASQAVARVMIGQGSGTIINLSSQAGFIALPGEAIYCASKAAVSHLTKCHAVEWGRTAHRQRRRAHVHPDAGRGACPGRMRELKAEVIEASRVCTASASRSTSRAPSSIWHRRRPRS